MYNRDEVIRQAAIAADNHATEVHNALHSLLARDVTAYVALRDALVAQAAGYESCAHDGSTHAARTEAAKAALAAWDGPAPSYYIQVGEHRLGTSDRELLRALSYETPYTNDETKTARPMSGSSNARISEIATALSEGLSGEKALLRAIALVRDSASVPTRWDESKIEDARLHVARVERQTAILRARAAGVSAQEIEKTVR